MSELHLAGQAHRRFNPLTEEWVLVSPQRSRRPWQGQVDEVETERRPFYDRTCYLCPGNTRAGGHVNPEYLDVFVFDNDFPALRPDVPLDRMDGDGLLVAEGESGICRVVCFSPRHDLTLARMKPAEIRRIVDVFAEQYEELGGRPDINHVQIFENKGAMMGCSNPHPHGQIWAQRSIPVESAKELQNQRAYHGRTGRTLLGDYLLRELEADERVVFGNDSFVVLVPFWAVWPFETLVIPRRPVSSVSDLTPGERDDLAAALARLTSVYDRCFAAPFPYSAGIHQRPTDGHAYPACHLHLHFYPPLLRSATIRKFMVGYEMLAEPQRDVTAEQSAARLRDLASR